MNNLTRFLTAIAFSVAGAAAHANAGVEQDACASSICFQLTPMMQNGDHGFLAQDGASRTPQGQMQEEQTA
ncbi:MULTISPECIES: hypothetical protein [unclassified Pseudomonas]|jgi:hypothetical protein|uniref:hypothetical protein n=1 Tax=unclassified Pseudomonas TaxID=196821 RepID=UPI00069E72C5|nr:MULTISPECIES: hypothetical protein [unclassified Pseudomonas]WPN49327.1 hypothetical protein QMK58_11965 [Pseudomonas sp. P8_241]